MVDFFVFYVSILFIGFFDRVAAFAFEEFDEVRKLCQRCKMTRMERMMEREHIDIGMDSAIGFGRIVGDASDLCVGDFHVMRRIASHTIHRKVLSVCDNLTTVAIMRADT